MGVSVCVYLYVCACAPVQCLYIRSITSNKLSCVPLLPYFTASGSDSVQCVASQLTVSIKFDYKCLQTRLNYLNISYVTGLIKDLKSDLSL